MYHQCFGLCITLYNKRKANTEIICITLCDINNA